MKTIISISLFISGFFISCAIYRNECYQRDEIADGDIISLVVLHDSTKIEFSKNGGIYYEEFKEIRGTNAANNIYRGINIDSVSYAQVEIVDATGSTLASLSIAGLIIYLIINNISISPDNHIYSIK